MKATKDQVNVLRADGLSNALRAAGLRNALRAVRQNIGTLVLLIMLAGLPLAAKAQAAAQGAQNPAAAPDASAAQAAAADPSYIIGADDMLDISVWKEPDVTRSVPVRPDGKISLPLISDVQAAGLTPSELAADITTRLKKFLNDPQVTVIVTAINSRRVYIVGEVSRPGAFPLLPDMTVLQALADAGGFTTSANTKKIHILRMVDGKQTIFPFEYHEVLEGNKTSENIKLLPGDEIVVP
jgi:polysaccharide export outer membrane protein